jgi:hypothetical protein
VHATNVLKKSKMSYSGYFVISLAHVASGIMSYWFEEFSWTNTYLMGGVLNRR